MGTLALLGVVAALMAVVMLAGWGWERAHRNAGIVDVLWAAGMGMAALVLAAGGSGAVLPRLLLAVLAGTWALRLAGFLARRVLGEPEDGRYRQLRQHWGGRGGPFLLFFLGQALLVVLFALPFAAVAANPVGAFTVWTALGIGVWLASVAGEAIADRQLARFRADPANKGRTCNVGLWRYSRHPNYFFEWLHWFAYVFLAIGSPLYWLAWSGPLLMYVFLRYLSGIPWTEAQALRTRGEDYRRYQQRTPMLFPWFPRDRDRGENPPTWSA
jgi:steroid 5-alpha reductase family enzyme